MRTTIDYSLYLVTDRNLTLGRPLEEVVTAAVQGGVTCVQLREKNCSSRQFIELGLMIQSIAAAHRVPLIINDRIDIALALNADGVHLGQTDMPLPMAKSIVGHKMIIGISAESVADAVTAARDGADYISVSPVFDTPTKTDTAPALGLEGIAAVRRAVSVPIVGIGGLNADNTGAAIRAGADGVAVVSAILSAESPQLAAKHLKQIIAGTQKQ